MGKLDTKAYSAILRTREAYRFDIGTLLMRLFAYTTTIGPITMLTLAGASAFEASSVSSLIAICMFFIAPRVSKHIDERGQSTVVPPACAISMVGFALMLATTQFGWPFWLNYLAAPLISFLPNAQALARTRWAFLIGSGRLGVHAPALKTAYAYEGVIEDITFMVGPATVIALSATIAPIAGMLIGAILYIAGTVLLISSKETEPEPGWKHADERDAAPDIDDQAGKPDGGKGENRDSSPDRCRRRKGKASVLRTSPVVRVQFAIMILFGAVYGSFDVSAITYCESIDSAGLASIVFAAESAFSVFVSLLFGMIGFTAPLRRQFVVFSVLFGCLYALFAFVGSPESLVIIACAAALSYAPMYITTNVTCERAVPSANLTEALSWLGSGQNIGMVIGPVTTGLLIDAWGPLAGFDLTACYALAIIACALACIPVLRKHL